MEEDLTLVVRVFFIDRDGKRSSMSIRLPFSIDKDTAISRAIAYASTLGAISNAAVPSVDVTYRFSDDDPGTAELGSDVRSKVCLLYRDEERYESILVPSPSPSIFEDEGTYTGIRVNQAITEMVPWVNPASTLLAGLKTQEGLEWPTEYLVGGLEL